MALVNLIGGILVKIVGRFFVERMNGMEKAGIEAEREVVDVGVVFGKLAENNRALLEGDCGGGKSANITKGQNAGQEADHVIPRAVCPELQDQVMNLELLPAWLNRTKSDMVTDRVKVFVKELYEAKLLSEERFKRLESR